MAVRRALLILALAALGVAGCTTEKQADDTDRQRLQVMRDDPLVRGHPGKADEGSEVNGFPRANRYSAWPVDKVRPAPDTPPAGRAVAATWLGDLQAQGWTMISARCQNPDGGAYQWEAFGFRVRDGVPYAIHMRATYNRFDGVTINLDLHSPFHADTKKYFDPPPAALATGGTCVETGDVDRPVPAQGTVWTLV